MNISPMAPDADARRILIVEDEAVFAKAVARRLARDGYRCDVVATLAEGAAALEQADYELLLLDMRLPDGSGLDLLERMRTESSLAVPVIVMTAYGDISDAVNAMKLSAADYLKKPIDLDELVIAVEKVLVSAQVSAQLTYSRAREAHAHDEFAILGDSAAVRELRTQIARIAALGSHVGMPPPTVLLVGETGTGKDVAARNLHAQSARRDRPFVHVDCASLPRDLIEAELFGHEKGAFTNAHANRIGLIEMAEDGVLFLDEVGELPLDLQGKLLAVLERRKLRRVGSARERSVDAWFVAATNRDVTAMLSDGSLRSDLYFRLNAITLPLPPLRERGDDVLILATAFGEQVARRYGMPAFALEADAKQRLCNYAWPGNVRELRHVVERAVLLSNAGQVRADTLMLADHRTATGQRSADIDGLTLDAAERLLLDEALARSDGNVSAAARALGITRMAMRYRMKKHGLE